MAARASLPTPPPRPLALLLLALLLPLSPRASAWPTNCSRADGTDWGPCAPGRESCGLPFEQRQTEEGWAVPMFHVRDASCALNDPCFPFFDPLHGLYHHFWQSRIAEPQGGDGGGPVIGHAVSADLARWAHMPVAIWNDASYDTRAIFTGSTTIVNGVPTMVYPGLCTERAFPGCEGYDFNVAVPANYSSDALLTHWEKPAYNPILNGTGDDPTTAWRTRAGEWRLTRKDGKVFFSEDFVHWEQSACVGDHCSPQGAFFNDSECSDFFPLPPPCDSPGCLGPGGPEPPPNFVHKQSANGDLYTLGEYDEGAAGTTGTWTPSPGVPLLQPFDATILPPPLPSAVYVAVGKSFWDPSRQRRVWWSWTKFPLNNNGTQSMPRVVNYHATLRRLVFTPPPEMEALRLQPPLFEQGAVSVAPNASVWLGDWAPGAGNQSELVAAFALPSTSGSFGVTVLNGAAKGAGAASPAAAPGSAANASGVVVRIDFDAPSFSANASIGGLRRTLPLLAGDSVVDVRVFVDRSILEVYVMGGRLAFTVPAGGPASAREAGMTLFAEGGSEAIVARNVSAWRVDSIWTTPEAVLRRRDELRAAAEARASGEAFVSATNH